MSGTNNTLYQRTPDITVVDNRGLTVRDIAYYRHPDTVTVTDERIIQLKYNARGFMTHSADPRLSQTAQTNFMYLTDLSGNILRTLSADAGTTIALNDAAGRLLMIVSGISTNDEGHVDCSQAVTSSYKYEGNTLPGRPLSITDHVTGDIARVSERFVYAGHTETEKNVNLAGICVSHYDTAGLIHTDSVALTGMSSSVTLRLLKNADDPDTVANWQGEEMSAWNDQLAMQSYTTLTTTDASGLPLMTTDAAGNLQRVKYDVAGMLSGSWLKVKGVEKAIIQSLTYSAAGQKLREVHGNGVVTTYSYEPQTLRLMGITTARPAGHVAGAKILQDLRYEYDPVGNVLCITNDAEETRFWRNQKVVPESRYHYDSLYQLVSTTGREMANVGQQGSDLPPATVPIDNCTYTNYTRNFSYDRGGNLTQIRHSAPATNNNYTTSITISDRTNRGVLSTLTGESSEVDALFTARGVQKQLQPGQQLSWTARAELLQVAPVSRDADDNDSESYRYDGSSLRVLKVSTQKTNNSLQSKRVLYLPGLEMRSTANSSGLTEDLQVITVGEAGRAQVRMLYWERGKPADISNGQLRYSYDNLVGSTGLEVDGDGVVISQEEYYPYGGTAVWAARSAIEADYKILRYSGKERDATGLYYYGYRYYQPWAGRWLSADPAGTMDGLNLYRMVKNNPVTYTDKNGFLAEKPNGFNWVRRADGGQHNFAGMSLFSVNENLDRKAEYLKNQGVRTVIALESNNYEASKEALNKQGITFILFPINDWHAPSVNQLAAYNILVDEYSKTGKVATHCWGGMGRTGVFLASRLLHIGEENNAQNALLAARERYHDKSVEMKAQYNALARLSDSIGLEPSVKVSSLQIHWDNQHGDDGMYADPGHQNAKKYAGVDENWMRSVAVSEAGMSEGVPDYKIFSPKLALKPKPVVAPAPVMNTQNDPLEGIPPFIPKSAAAPVNKTSLWSRFTSFVSGIFRRLFSFIRRK